MRLTPVPAGVVNLDDHERLAQAGLSPEAWAYFAGGAGDEHTLAANRAAWQQRLLRPRVLRPLAGGHTRVHLLGREAPCPVLAAPVAYQAMAHPDGELAMAHATAMQGAGLVLSSQSSTPLEQVAGAVRHEAGRGPMWFQLYWQADRAFNRALVQRAEAQGFEAIVLTVDAPCQGVRDRERRAGFRLPAGVRAVMLQEAPVPPQPPLGPGQSALFDGLLHHAPCWDDVAWLRSITALPIVLKGILHPEDAVQAVAAGAAGLIVSNHGGRTLDTALPTARALPEVRAAVGPGACVLVDGGIRRGTDVLKALALGADAVLVGRPIVFGLATAGAMGVAHVLRLLRDELEAAMALCGCRTVADLGPSLLAPD